jgi:hypothetical protein
VTEEHLIDFNKLARAAELGGAVPSGHVEADAVRKAVSALRAEAKLLAKK